jgi:large subunit ribosomal protein L29
MKISEFANKSLEDLRKNEKVLREQIWHLRFKQGLDDLENLHQIKSVKRDLARVLTVINQKKHQS